MTEPKVLGVRREEMEAAVQAAFPHARGLMYMTLFWAVAAIVMTVSGWGGEATWGFAVGMAYASFSYGLGAWRSRGGWG